VKFVFSDPVITSGNEVYISRIDLAKLIDPVLRPSFIKNAGNFRTLINLFSPKSANSRCSMPTRPPIPFSPNTAPHTATGGKNPKS
ncbi:MAG: hypothetical protein ACK5VX_11195, partial [Akkermansiaceae bacterium]